MSGTGAAAAALALLAMSAAAADAGTSPLSEPGQTFGSRSFVLDNGLQVVVIPNRRAPLVHHAVWYKAGAADEPPGLSGIAHMLEHLMFKGTETAPDGAFSDIVARNGGNENAFTSQDYTGYYQNIAADRLELVMRLEADRMANLAFSDEHFHTERQVVLEERRGRVDNRPGALLREQVAAAHYLNHPYGLPTVGWEHEIRAWAPDDARDFYRARYAPNNAAVVVAGDVDPEALRALAEATYGEVPSRPVPPRIRPAEPPHRAARRLVMSHPRVTDREWSRSYLAPSYAADPDGIAAPLDVFATVLGGGATSRLYRSLVVESGVATGAGAWYSGTGLDSARFVIHVSPKPEAEIAAIEAAVDAEIARLLEGGVTEEELERAKFGIHASTVYSRDRLETMGRIFGASLATGLTVEDVERWPAEAQAVTGARAVAAGAAVLAPERSVTALLLPEGAGEEGEAGP